MNNITKELNLFYSIVVFGSYAQNKETKESDLDILILVKNKPSILNSILNSIKRKELTKLDFHVITESEFKKMLNVKEENLAKEILRNNLPIINPQTFYNIIK